MPLYLALLHHPVRDRVGAEVTSAVTTLDVHDLARVGRTYDARAVFVVTPVPAQAALVEELRAHFVQGAGAAAAPDRAEALSLVVVRESLAAAQADVRAREGEGAAPLLTVFTTAQARAPGLRPEAVRAALAAGVPVLLCFGTANGLGDVPLSPGDGFLPPLQPGAYNHLPVRGALAILVDRLVGSRWD